LLADSTANTTSCAASDEHTVSTIRQGTSPAGLCADVVPLDRIIIGTSSIDPDAVGRS